MNKPSVIYRYVSLSNVDRLEQLFVQSKLFFARPSQFNDPFEFKPKRMSTDTSGLDVSLVEKYIDPSLDSLYDAICAELDQFGVCCFSERPDDINMWSYYGDGHKGACVGFETNHHFFEHLQPVDRNSTRHDIDLKKWEPADIVKVMLRKHPGSFEQEWRLLRKPGGELVQFPLDTLKSIVFGARCPQPRQNLVRTLLAQRQIAFHCAHIDKFEYKLNISRCA